MVQVRLLNKDDIPIIGDLLKRKSKISNVAVSDWPWETWEIGMNGYMTHDNCRVIGCFEDDVLRAFVAQEYLAKIPMWIMGMIGQDTDCQWLKVGHGEYLNACLVDASQDAESKGVFEVIYSVPTKWLRTTKYTQPTSPVWSRYNVYVDAIVKAGESPKYELHRYLCGPHQKQHDRAIKRCSLKMHHRTEFLNKYLTSKEQL